MRKLLPSFQFPAPLRAIATNPRELRVNYALLNVALAALLVLAWVGPMAIFYAAVAGAAFMLLFMVYFTATDLFESKDA